MNLRKYVVPFFIGIFLISLTYFTLWPGSRYMFDARTDVALSDGSDPAAAPYMHWTLQKAFEEHPSHFLWGAIFSDRWNPPEGYSIWVSFFERLLTITSSPFVIEQVNTWYAFGAILASLLGMFLLGRSLGWSRELSTAASIAFALCSYAKARAKVHSVLAGLHFLPFTLLGFVYLKRTEDKNSLWKAGICFFIAAISPFYYIIILAGISPFFLWFYFSDDEVRSNLNRSIKRLVYAAAPSVIFILFTLLFPNPPGTHPEHAYPITGQAQEWPHPFTQTYSASPIDYLTADISWGLKDWNPLRGQLSAYALEDAIRTSNPHERTNGIRWPVLFLALFVIYYVFKNKLNDNWAREIKIFAWLGLVGFLLSMPPKWGDLLIGPSALLHLLVGQFRVPSRAGVVVLFSFVLIAGYFVHYLPKLNGFHRFKKLIAIPGLVILIVLFDMPPMLNTSPIAQILPVQKVLSDLKDNCGVGMYFPYVSNTYGLSEYYYFLQRLRSTECRPLNAGNATKRDIFLLQNFALTQDLIGQIQKNDGGLKQRLAKIAQCSGLNWIMFDPRMPPEWEKSMCQQLGWKMADDQVCLAPNLSTRLKALPEVCGATL